MHEERWHRRAQRRLRHSLKWRLVAVFLLLALALAAIFIAGMQRALGIGWRDAARPLVTDYVDRLVAELGSPPSVDRARALTERLPVTVRIRGPLVQWDSEDAPQRTEARDRWRRDRWGADADVLARTTADGHRIEFGLNVRPWRDRPRSVAWITLAVLLLATWLAFAYVRRLLRPLEDIRAGAHRFGRGAFGEPIPVRRRDELGELAGDVNAMAASIHRMLEAKRALLLAISHELRSPITRARLNTELLPEDGEAGARRQALLRDLQEMAELVSDLLESERLGQGHAALHREAVDPGTVLREALQGQPVDVQVDEGLPPASWDAARMRLLLRNLVANARQHGAADRRPVVTLARGEGRLLLSVRDFGPGADPAVLPQLADAFYRPDPSRG
ncbi:MAG TPA: HAMP domain-containing sensor histidine kinase, partial [Ramlibacter sp.]|nr:HAMP domain-containing sensor histidine kinase [Ramlibacter sp.]